MEKTGSQTAGIVLRFPPWRARKVIPCGCGCPRKITHRSDDGQPRFATPACSLTWYREHDAKKIVTMHSGLRS